MRKHLFGTILVLAALAACNKEVETPVVDNGKEDATPGKVTLTFTAAIGDDTRTEYPDDKTAGWVIGDKISVCVANAGNTDYKIAEFEATSSTDAGMEFTGKVEEGYTTIVSGVYPANEKHVFTDGAVTSVYLPDTYELGTANDNGIALPMVGEMDENENFVFHHICGALKITVIDIFNALTFTTAGETITGSFPLTNRRIAIPANSSASKVTFNYGRLQAYLDNGNFGPRNSRTFYIPVPDGTLAGGATMALKNDDDKVVYEKKTSDTNEITFNSNRIKRFPEIGLNLRNDWSITPDLSGVNPEIVFDPDNENQLYIRLSTTKSTFETTYHGSVEAFLEARIQSSSNSTQTGLQPYTPKANSIPTTTEDYLQDPEKVYIMCGVNKTGSTNRKCDFDYFIYQVTLEDPATDSYRAWLGQWTVNDGTNEDTWTISRKKANATYSITGIAGRTSIGADGVFSVSDGSLSLSSQSEIGTYQYQEDDHLVSLLKRSNTSGNVLSSGGNYFGLVIVHLLLNNNEVTFGETNNGYGYYWRNAANTGWSTVNSLKREKIQTITRVTE